MNKKRILIVTGSDEKMHSVLNLTLPSKSKYASMHGYDFMCMKSFKNFPSLNVDSSLPIGLGFSRTLSTFMLINLYDIVVWLDGDSIITNPSIKIEDIIDEKHTLYFSYDWCTAADGSTENNNFSSGNFIIQATSNVILLVNTFIENIKFFINDNGADQALFNAMYRTPNLTEHIMVLDHKYLNAVPECIMRTNVWSSDKRRGQKNFRIESPWNSDCFIAHLTGCSNEDRIDLLNNELKQYT